jgi:hypothetical protein
MSFLTPLYIIGLAAVALPVLFHLVRRMPRGRQPFGSLMFLSASPPRLTRRSRLDNLLLLLLRALALSLVVLAFARPFVRAIASLGVDRPPGRKIAVLVDTSASMRRQGLWEQATAEARQVFDDLGPGDDASLVAFDEGIRTVVGFDDARAAGGDPARKIALLGDALGQLAPGWQATDLGLAITAAADAVGDAGASQNSPLDTERLVVVISDLQEGSRLDALAHYRWPDDVRLVVSKVASPAPTNAGLHPAAAATTSGEDGRSLRVRVSNDRDSLVQQFRLAWSDGEATPPAESPIDVYVPAGESRIVPVPCPADAAIRRLVLSGDDQPFDNTLYTVPLRQEQVDVLYVGSDEPDDAGGLHYYLERIFPETPGRKVNITAIAPDTASVRGNADARGNFRQSLIVVGQAIPDDLADQLKAYTAAGGTVLFVLRDAAGGKPLARLLGRDALPVEEAAGRDYAMLGQIDFAHPLFAPFADPRFSDFTKIHFWKHRVIEGDVDEARVPARFDDGSPAVLEQALGKGRVVVLAAGWHPADSELARSSKFVPLLSEVLNRAGGREQTLPQYVVGARVPIPLPAAEGGSDAIRVVKPDGSEVELPTADSGSLAFDAADQPGVYRMRTGATERLFAVNLAPSESRTTPLDAEELQQHGVELGRRQSRAQIAEHRRQMQDTEMENHQKLWQWLLAAALGVLIVEIGLGGYLARRPAEHNTSRTIP